MDWRVDVLERGGWPVTEENMRFLSAWQKQEGGHTDNDATWNWLNSTQGTGKSINQVGVKAYSSYNTGVTMTVATINNGRYPNIVQGLAAGDPYSQYGVAQDLSTWVSGKPTGNLEYAGRVLGAAPATGLAGTGAEAVGCGAVMASVVVCWSAVIFFAWQLHGLFG